MGVRTWEPTDEPPPLPIGPRLGSAVALTLLLLLGLLANGRPIGAPETRAAEHQAAALAGSGAAEPAADPAAAPLVPSLLAAPLFALARPLFTLDEAGRAVAGKLAASAASALAAGVLFLAVGRRRPEKEAAATAALFALGSGVWAASQALWPQPFALLFLSLALLCVARAEHQPGWAGAAGLPLGLAAAADPTAAVLAATLLLGLCVRWPRRLPALLLGALPGAALFAFEAQRAGGALAALAGPERAPGTAHLALLVSPAKGWLLFTPLVIVAGAGLVRAFRNGERWLAVTLGSAVAFHWAWIGALEGWHGGGEAWGPRLLTAALAPLLLVLPEGLDALGRTGALLAAASVAVQLVGVFAGGERWARLNGPPSAAGVAWDLAKSPLVLHVTERVVRPAAPRLVAGRVAVSEHPLVILGPSGSRITFARDAPAVTGVEPTCRDVHLQGGARVRDGRLQLSSADDALFLRVTSGARLRPLQLRIVGRGRGTLYVAERTFWTELRVRSYAISGAFRFRHPYDYPTSGGPDLTISVAGTAALEFVALLPPGAPDDPLDLESVSASPIS
jgi:hypothetical protein